MEKTAIQKAIEKIDEQIEIAQKCRIEASKVRDETSTSRHHGMKIALVAYRQELVNLLELEKLQNHSEYMRGWYNGFNSKENETKGLENSAVEWFANRLTERGLDYSIEDFEQAKEMEETQMFDYIKANYVIGENTLKFHQEEFEKYYNKKFKSE